MIEAPIQGSLTQRSAWWALEFTKLLAEDPELRESIPDGAHICVMPAEDLEVASYNVKLVLAKAEQEAPGVVFVLLKRRTDAYIIVPYLPRQAHQYSA